MTVGDGARQTLLCVRGLGRRFGGLVAVSDYRLDLAAGELVGLIGPNGAGKTTVFNLLSGALAPDAGSIRLRGREVAGWPPHRIARLGLARTFQTVRLFGELSVVGNVMTGMHVRHGRGLLATVLDLPAFRRAEEEIRERAHALLDELGLAEHADRPAGSLPYGIQRLVEIARALATEPALLLLDEPAAGMNPAETGRLGGLLQRLRARRGLALLLVEHDMRLVMRVCERIQVLDHGRLIAEGPPDAVRTDPAVLEAYLGRRRPAHARTA